MFDDLCHSLNEIHEKDLIHCDLHSGNILVQGCACFITDLGLCGPVDDESSNKIYESHHTLHLKFFVEIKKIQKNQMSIALEC